MSGNEIHSSSSLCGIIGGGEAHGCKCPDLDWSCDGKNVLEYMDLGNHVIIAKGRSQVKKWLLLEEWSHDCRGLLLVTILNPYHKYILGVHL